MLVRDQCGIGKKPRRTRPLHHTVSPMKANSVTIDRSSTPSRIDFSPSFNLCGLFCDRHIAEGRGAKVLARGRTWTLSFGEMYKSVCRFANALKSLGVQPGDRVMLLAKDTPAFYIAFL